MIIGRIKENIQFNGRKVSTRFEFFQPGFVYIAVLVSVFVFVVLDVEFCAASNDVIFERGYRSKTGTLAKNTRFFENLGKVISARIC